MRELYAMDSQCWLVGLFASRAGLERPPERVADRHKQPALAPDHRCDLDELRPVEPLEPGLRREDALEHNDGAVPARTERKRFRDTLLGQEGGTGRVSVVEAVRAETPPSAP
jgi:hypothetical protein